MSPLKDHIISVQFTTSGTSPHQNVLENRETKRRATGRAGEIHRRSPPRSRSEQRPEESTP